MPMKKLPWRARTGAWSMSLYNHSSCSKSSIPTSVNFMFSYSKRQAELAAAMEEDARLEKEKAER